MIIKNTTDKKTPKVIGFGPYWIMPGEEKTIPDEFIYVREFDKFDRPTGRKALLPAVAVQQKLGMIELVMPAPAPEKAVPVEEKKPEPDNTPDTPNDDEKDAPAEEAKAEDKPKRRTRKTTKTTAPATDTAAAPEE